MQSASKKVALVTGANKGMSMTNSIRKSVRRIGSTLIAATLDVHVAAAEAPVFDFVAAEDVLPKVLTGYGLLPGVVRTSGNTGPWDQPGSARTVHLASKWAPSQAGGASEWRLSLPALVVPLLLHAFSPLPYRENAFSISS